MLLLANNKDIQKQSALLHMWLRGRRLQADQSNDETKPVVLQVPSLAGGEAAL